MHPPRYARNEVELEESKRQARQWECPHCGQPGTLNGHGYLRGSAENAPQKDARRGRRFFCSDRGRRPGCGRTFSVWLAQVIVGASVRTGAWWRFTAARLGGASVLAAWESARSGFSLESAYRWWRRWRASESAVRTALWRGREPPEKSLREAIEHACGAADPLAVFQVRTQRAWPGLAS